MNFVKIRGYEYEMNMQSVKMCEIMWEIPLVILFRDEREIWPPKTEYFIAT